MPDPPFTLEFYREPGGNEPVRRWMEKTLTQDQRRALDAALTLILAVHGLAVCGTPYGRQLGHGLFEFRLDEHEATVSRKWAAQPVSLHRGPSRRRQQREIARARARLAAFACQRRD